MSGISKTSSDKTVKCSESSLAAASPPWAWGSKIAPLPLLARNLVNEWFRHIEPHFNVALGLLAMLNGLIYFPTKVHRMGIRFITTINDAYSIIM